jgi:putative ABC transport system permease protein
MALSDLTIVTRSLWARRFSTITTALTVAVAVALMLVLTTMRDAGQRAFERGTGNMHVLVSNDSSPLVSVLNAIFYANAPQRAMTMAQYDRLFPKDDDGAPRDRRVEFALPVQQGDSFRGFPTMATTPDFFKFFQPAAGTAGDGSTGGQPFTFAKGRPFQADFEVVLGSEVARTTGLRPESTPGAGDASQFFITHGYSSKRGHLPAKGDVPRPGEKARIHSHSHGAPGGDPTQRPWREPVDEGYEDIHAQHPFTVVGVLEPTGSAHDRAVFIHLHATWLMHAEEKRFADAGEAARAAATVADLTPQEKLITGVYVGVRTRKGSDVSASIGPIFASLRADPTLTVALPGQEIRKLFQIVGSVDKVIIAIAAAVMVSSGIAIMLALYNSMEQRRHQIAVLRVLGASALRIFWLIMTESALIGLAGAAAGVLLCLMGMQLVVQAMKRNLGLVFDPAVDPTLMLPILAGTVLLATLAGLIPAVAAYRTPVAKSLRPIA